ncbi:OB-fold nucleic acid binding domain-containing protein [Dermacoccaceae bacterium W4C1]
MTVASWRKLSERLSRSAQDEDAEEFQRAVLAHGDTPIAALTDRQIASVRGSVRAVSVRPKADHVWALVVELDDGSRTVKLVWLGRRQIAGIEPGAYLSATGRVCLRGDDPIMYNPTYELLQAP